MATNSYDLANLRRAAKARRADLDRKAEQISKRRAVHGKRY